MLSNSIFVFGRYFLKASYFRSLIFKVIVKSLPIPYTEFINYIGKQNAEPDDNGRNLKISCIVTCNDLSRLDFLVEALNSIRNQNYADIQILIVDGFGGLDRILLEREEYFDSRFVFREFASTRPSEARNAFLHELDGDVILFLDDDNLFLPGYFFELAQWHILNPSVDVGIFRYVLFKGNLLVDVPISRRLTGKILARRNVSDTSAISFKAKSVTKDLWPIMEHNEDWELLKKCLSSGYKIEINNSYGMLYRVHLTNRSAPMSRKKSSKG
jgi:glycosyltransferase involved in cell wall biosynthesis